MIAERLSVKEVTIDGFLKAILYSTNVIEIIWDTSIREIEIIHLEKMQKAVFELGGGKKSPLFFTMHEFLGITKDARKYATSEEGVKYTLATTVLVDDLAKKLLFNFFMNMNKPKVPTKSFRTREDCFVWLEKVYAEAN